MRCRLSVIFTLLVCGVMSAHARPLAPEPVPPQILAQAVQPAPRPARPPRPCNASRFQCRPGPVFCCGCRSRRQRSCPPNLPLREFTPASPTSLFLMGVAPGRTTVIATTESGAAIAQYDVTITPGAGGQAPVPSPLGGGLIPDAAAPATISPAMARAMQAAIAQTVQGASGVSVRAAGTDAILTGTVPTAVAAQQAEAIARGYLGDKAALVDNLTVLGAIQVNVRVRIAEIDRQVTRQLGINWQALGSGPGWRFGLLSGAAASGAISPLLPLGLAPLANTTAAANQLGAGFTSGNKLWDVNNVIDALAEDQLITVLAEPNLTALSGETASFLAGGEFPIPIAGTTSNGSTTVTVEFKTYGISLAVVPTVMSATRLNLRIRPEVSQLTTNGAVSVPIGNGTLTIPALTVRRAETTVELGSGQSFAIAGLLEKTTLDDTNALPGIGELPVIGALFKSNNFQRGESELVIIVTPYVVQPAASPAALHLPTDGFMTLWAMMAAPLIAGNNLTEMKPEIAAILMNKEAIDDRPGRAGAAGTAYMRRGRWRYGRSR